jgi:phosphohistidine phosphatase
MKLYLVQHGEAAATEVDPERPLTAAGREAVSRLAGLLGARQIQVDHIIHSGKLRASQTATILAESIGPGIALEVYDSIAPMDTPAVIAEEISHWQEDALVVGHLPFMAKLATLLVSDRTDPPIVGFTPGTVLCLEHTDSGDWQINWMLRPELLG